jgi:hypothetical protein
MIGQNAKTGDIYYRDKTYLDITPGQKIEAYDVNGWANTTDDWTLFVKMNNRSSGTVQPLFDIQRPDTASLNRLLISLFNDNTVWIVMRGSSSGTWIWKSVPFATIGEMTIQLAFNGNFASAAGTQLYVNGVQIASASVSNAPSGTFSTAFQQRIKLGQTFFDGDNDTDAIFYNISLSDYKQSLAEMAIDLANGNQTPTSGGYRFAMDFENLHELAVPHIIQDTSNIQQMKGNTVVTLDGKKIPTL